MMIRLLALLMLCIPQFAHAQNCESVPSGLDAYAKPQNAGRDIIGQSLDDIMDRGWIMFAVYEDFPPFSFEEDGKLTGIDIDLGHLIADFLGVEARFFATAAAENVDGDLRNNVWRGKITGGQIANVMLHIPYNRELACRNELVVMNGQYFNESIAIAYSREAYPENPPTPAYFRYDTVGVENDSLADFYLSSLMGGQLIAKMTRYPDTAAAMAALAAGEVMAVMGARTQLEHGATDTVAIHTPPLPGLALGTWTLGVAVRHNWRPLSYSVDDAIREAVNNGELASIFARYGAQYTPPEW